MALLSNEILRSEPSPIEPTFFREVTDGSRRPWSLPMFFNWRSIYNNFINNSSSDPWAGVNAYMPNRQSAESMFWTALGGHSRGQGYSYDMHREANSLQWIKNDTLGFYNHWNEYQYSSQTAETNVGARMIFLRNFHPTSAQTLTNTFYLGGTSNVNNATQGAGISLLVPNTSLYSTCSATSHTQLYTYTSNTSNFNSSNISITIQPQQTVALIMANSSYYYTQTSAYVTFWYYNYVYNLTSWGNNWIQPDLRMTMAAQSFNSSGYNNSSRTDQYQSHLVWNWCATQFGDR